MVYIRRHSILRQRFCSFQSSCFAELVFFPLFKASSSFVSMSNLNMVRSLPSRPPASPSHPPPSRATSALSNASAGTVTRRPHPPTSLRTRRVHPFILFQFLLNCFVDVQPDYESPTPIAASSATFRPSSLATGVGAHKRECIHLGPDRTTASSSANFSCPRAGGDRLRVPRRSQLER